MSPNHTHKPDRCVNKRDLNQRNFIEGRQQQKVGPFLFCRNGSRPNISFMLFTCVQFRPLLRVLRVREEVEK